MFAADVAISMANVMSVARILCALLPRVHEGAGLQLKATKTQLLLHSPQAHAALRELKAHLAFLLRSARICGKALHLGYHIDEEANERTVINKVMEKMNDVRAAPRATSLHVYRYSLICLSSARFWMLLNGSGRCLRAAEREWQARVLAAPMNATPPAVLTSLRCGGCGVQLQTLSEIHHASLVEFAVRAEVVDLLRSWWIRCHTADTI